MNLMYQTVFEKFGVDELDEVPNRKTGIEFLMVDGNLLVPCSRYGNDTADCAPVAWRLAYLMHKLTGEPMTYHGLDSDMGLVVNDSDDVAYIIRQYGYRHYR